ncbi:hypothetical protein EGT07_20875 [Herbaspirillum sp. HC18]|nr:hypothetical protein EGT07_20875 [Herbaspirillum sp. HC18]
MQPSGLHVDQAPPISVPFRFFLTAPVFGLLCAAVMLWQGGDLFASRWSPATLAAVHLLTLGFMSMVMIGAMMQILPVLIGAPVAAPRLVAAIVHPALVLGALLFACGFLFLQPLLLRIAVLLLGLGVAVFLAAMIHAFFRIRTPTPTVVAIWLATAAFGVTLLFGLMLGSSHSWGTALPSTALRDLHPAWGLMGWTGLLLAGVAYQVVPMFQVTPHYPRWLMNGFGATVFVALALLSVALWWDDAAWHWLALACVLLLGAVYIALAGITVRLQLQRRRRLPDVTLEFWRVGMVCMALSALLWVSQRFPLMAFPQADVLLGVLVIIGAALSFISGMLCKIVPFLSWFHLQAQVGIGGTMPNMKMMLPEKAQRLQFRLHVAALLLCIGAAFWPNAFVYPAALAFGAASAAVLWNIVSVTRLYRQLVRK